MEEPDRTRHAGRKWLPLAESKTISTVEEAQAFVSNLFVPHQLELLSRGAELNLKLRAVWSGSTGLIFMDYGDRVRISPEPLTGFVLVQVPLEGAAQLKIGHKTIESTPGKASLPSCQEPSVMQWSKKTPHLCLYVRQDQINRVASSLYGVPELAQDVQLGSAIDLRTEPGQRFLAALRDFHDDLQSHGNVTGMHRLSQENLLGRLLLAAPNSLSQSLDVWPADGPVRNEQSSRLAHDFEALVDHHFHEDVAISDFAERLSVSIRTLQVATAAAFDLTPSKVLLRRRLEHSRKLLSTSENSHRPVADIALASGFNHLGRFASAYKQYFGELPRQTRQSVTPRY
ncbi:AraC family transcriptional regulator [Nesterenkonia natronophila]|uniref:AraC family transcriptional regulator n=1 Tax=Nesterenkonia natronophila TaxID=2174932 RepID=A0A3A4G2P1_9MICC|nr:AraC family transcriptional regulator [Nesterenkonia natronophila]RJN32449.1 AraC family transcriptional regulator [Nesterenkonia natronophila]